MAKTSGGVRTLKTGSREYSTRELEVIKMREIGLYSSVEFSKKGGGYVAVEKSTMKHKPEELEAAGFLADKGYKVTLKDEAGEFKTPDGKIFSYFFEQHTPSIDKNSAKHFSNSLEHAKVKKADIALVYMKTSGHTKKSVIDGIKEYESHKTNIHRFKQIIIVTKDGRVHKHRHN